MPGQQQPDANMMMRAQRISEQQRAAVQMQQTQHQHHNQPLQGGANTPRPTSQHSSPPAMANGVNGLGNVNGVNGVNGVAGISQQNFMNNAQAMMAAYNNAASGANHGSPQPLMHMNNAGSPGIRPNMPMPAAINNQLSQYEAQYRAKNPNLTPEQARQLATEHLTRIMVAQRQSAMSAAAGGPGQHGIANSIAATTSPHQYAALLRQQQQAQAQQQAQQQAQAQQQQQQQQQASGASQAASSPGQASHNRQSSESATPSAAH
jgi:chromatin modification-related protein VID21